MPSYNESCAEIGDRGIADRMIPSEKSWRSKRAGGIAVAGDVSLPVVPRSIVRASRMSRRRAAALILVHLVIIGHVAHWLVTGRTLSPVEPSEAMYALNDGYLNAGAVFFASALLLTLVFGRFVCGWACHLVAYQDFSAWLLKRVGIRPKPFRSRFLYYAPLVLALYMFVWPTAYRVWIGQPRPTLTNHLMTTEFWATFPGAGVALLTVVMCGLGAVYFLGSKGFCTYACPYGGFFAVADRFSPGRIVVDESCEHSGHCTTACTSNVRVHEEVARFGMVVDPGCMKCMDCLSVCPNDALRFSLAAPSLTRRASKPGKAPVYDFSLTEELALGVVGLLSLVTYRGLYGQVPLLLAMALAGMTAFVLLKFFHLIRRPNVRLQQFSLKRGGAWTNAGRGFGVLTVVLLLFLVHSGAVQYHVFRGTWLAQSLSIGDEVWLGGRPWREAASESQREALDRATAYLERSDEWGLSHTPEALSSLVWLYLAGERNADALGVVDRLVALTPEHAEVHRGRAGVLRKMHRWAEAEASYRATLALRPDYAKARAELCAMLVRSGSLDTALAEYGVGLAASPEDLGLLSGRAGLLSQLGRHQASCDDWRRVTALSPASGEAFAQLGAAQLAAGQIDGALATFTRATALSPDDAGAQYNLGLLLLQSRRTEEAVEHLRAAVDARPGFAEAHYHLAVGFFMLGQPDAALEPIREALRLNPGDADARGFLRVVQEELDRRVTDPTSLPTP